MGSPKLLSATPRKWASGADFNGDGFRDLAVAKSNVRQGLVQVLYGSAAGFEPNATQQWSASDFGKVSATDNNFGAAMSSGDFDADGFSDLAVTDRRDPPELKGGGTVSVLYGSSVGLSTDRSQQWSQDSSGIPGSSEDGDLFGAALAAGTLGFGPEDDLAIGIPGENGSGAVLVLFRGAKGLTAGRHQDWTQATPGLAGRPERYDDFGRALTVGDFDGGGYDELVIGVPYDRVDGIEGAGSVYVLHGTKDGPTVSGVQHWSQGSGGLTGRPESTTLFGDAFAVGHFTGGPHLDLAVGCPGWTSIDTGGAGMVHVIYGSKGGLTASGNQRWTEYDLGEREVVTGAPEDSPGFGETLVTAEFGRGPADDLVTGVPEAMEPDWASGAVQVLYGGSGGFRASRTQRIGQVTPGIKGRNLDEASFGSAIAVVGPFPAADGKAYPALAVGAPGHGQIEQAEHPGTLNIIRGSADGLTAAGDELLTAEQLPQQPIGSYFARVLTS